MATSDKSLDEQVRELRKLIADAEDILAQVKHALETLESRLAPVAAEAPPRSGSHE